MEQLHGRRIDESLMALYRIDTDPVRQAWTEDSSGRGLKSAAMPRFIATTLSVNRRRITRRCVFSYSRTTLCCYDLHLDPMTSIYEVGLDILKMYLRTKNEVSRSRLSTVIGWTRQTDRQTDRHRYTDRRDQVHYHPHSLGNNAKSISKLK